jgi:hypothetical protein
MTINFGLGPNACRVGPGEILTFRPVQPSKPMFKWHMRIKGITTYRKILSFVFFREKRFKRLTFTVKAY